MPETPGPKPPPVLATTFPFFALAATIVNETWHDLDQMAGVLAQRLDRLGAESDERAFLELIASGVREVVRRLDLTEGRSLRICRLRRREPGQTAHWWRAGRRGGRGPLVEQSVRLEPLAD